MFSDNFLFYLHTEIKTHMIMAEWWQSLSLSMQILWAITLSASLIFIIQSIMTFIGAAGGSDFDINSDVDTDFSADSADLSVDSDLSIDSDTPSHPSTGMGLLTFRNFVNFFLGFGWTAILLGPEVKSTALLLFVSVMVGVGLVAIVMLLFKWVSSMQESGNIDVFKSAVDCQGKVYLTIPGNREGFGKVQITINNAVREYEALTDGDTLKTGTAIRVVEVIDSNTLLVEEQNTLII